MRRVREGFFLALMGSMGIALAGAFVQQNIVPPLIWVGAVILALAFGRPA